MLLYILLADIKRISSAYLYRGLFSFLIYYTYFARCALSDFEPNELTTVFEAVSLNIIFVRVFYTI